MKEIVGTILLLTAALLIYLAVIGGEDGMASRVRNGGGRVQESVQRLNP